jgi:hypothetical protein
MNKQTIITATLLICILLPTSTQAKSEDNTNEPTIFVTKLDITEEALNLTYEIRNDSEDDAWILAWWHKSSESTFGMGVVGSVSKEAHTLMIGARFKGTTPGWFSTC